MVGYYLILRLFDFIQSEELNFFMFLLLFAIKFGNVFTDDFKRYHIKKFIINIIKIQVVH